MICHRHETQLRFLHTPCQGCPVNNSAQTQTKPRAQRIPRPEYPRPQLKRSRWYNLNGEWQFAQDPDNRGLRDAWYTRTSFPERILVPFPPQSEASGVAATTIADVVWYTRRFDCSEGDSQARLLLHVGASDYATQVYVNGQQVGQHRGGYAPFAIDIAHAVVAGENQLSVRCEDTLSWSQPRGKQAGTTRWPIDYDGVSGIWQSVWLEPVADTAVEHVQANFCLADQSLSYCANLNRAFTGELEILVRHKAVEIVSACIAVEQRREIKVLLDLSPHGDALPLWSPDAPNLCDVRLRLREGSGELVDEASSYLGLRDIRVSAGTIELNGQPVYLRGVLDQGYFPGGWYSALQDTDYQRDIELTKAMGFNCARKHQKAEDPRYLYWADRLGLMVWAEMPSGRVFSSELVQDLTAEWMSLLLRDRGHPCIIAWVPFNESWGVWHQAQRPQQRAFVDALTQLTRSLDTSRLIIGNDGWEYSSGDLWTLHLYEEPSASVETDFAERLAAVLAEPQSRFHSGGRVGALPGADVTGLPVVLSECGGVGFAVNPQQIQTELFAYGDVPTTRVQLEQRMRAIIAHINSATQLQGFVWTQLTDVQQEMNGLLSFARQPKLPISQLHDLFSRIGESVDPPSVD